MEIGTPTVFETGTTRTPAVCYLDDDHIVVAYCDNADRFGKVVCASISGTTPSFGTIVTFDELAEDNDIMVAALDSTHFVIAYHGPNDGSGHNPGKCIAGTVSGTTITLGSSVTFGAAYDEDSLDICAMDATHFVLVFHDDNADTIKVQGGSVSTRTITMGAVDTAYTSWSSDNAICSLDSSHFVIVYGNTTGGYVACGTLSGNTVTITQDGGTEYGSGRASSSSITAMDSSHFVIAFTDHDDSDTPKVIAGSVSGTTITITKDSATTFDTGPVSWLGRAISLTAYSPTGFLISFIDGGDSDKGKVIAGSVSGNTITIINNSAATFEVGAIQVGTRYGVNIASSGGYCSVAYADYGDSEKGKVCIVAPFIQEAGISIAASCSVAALCTRVLPSAGVSVSSISSMTAVGDRQILAQALMSVAASLSSEADVQHYILLECDISSIASMTAASSEVWGGSLTVAVIPSLALAASLILEGIGSITSISSVFAQCIGAQYCTIDIDAVSSMAASPAVDWNGAIAITAVSSLDLEALAYITKTMGFTGTLGAGDVLIIDTDNLTVTLNGANVREDFTGEFWHLYDGTNELAWHDSDGSRTVELKVEHEPRSI